MSNQTNKTEKPELKPSQELKKIISVKIDSPLVWMDMEMSGLDPETSVILEIATIVTDNRLNILAEGPNLVIHQTTSVIEKMDEWNRTHHGASGLIKRVRESKLTLKAAEEQTLEFLKAHIKEKSSPLCGNSIGQDRRFLFKYMPRLESFLHYRSIDVSTVKELIARWYPQKFAPPKKKGTHKAMTDIRESIEELLYYRENFLIKE